MQAPICGTRDVKQCTVQRRPPALMRLCWRKAAGLGGGSRRQAGFRYQADRWPAAQMAAAPDHLSHSKLTLHCLSSTSSTCLSTWVGYLTNSRPPPTTHTYTHKQAHVVYSYLCHFILNASLQRLNTSLVKHSQVRVQRHAHLMWGDSRPFSCTSETLLNYSFQAYQNISGQTNFFLFSKLIRSWAVGSDEAQPI